MQTQIILGIEIAPSLYTKNEYIYEEGLSREESRISYLAYLEKELSNSSLSGLKPIYPGSWHFDINQIKVNELKEIIKDHLKDIDLSDYEEQCGCLCGGVVIKQDEKTMLTSSCCGDFSDLHNWEEIEEKLNDNWEHLWIGHPWVYYKSSGEDVGFSECVEKTLEDFKDIKIVFQLPKKEFFSQLKSLRKDLIQFELKIATALKEMGIVEAKGVADYMIRN